MSSLLFSFPVRPATTKGSKQKCRPRTAELAMEEEEVAAAPLIAVVVEGAIAVAAEAVGVVEAHANGTTLRKAVGLE